MGKSIPVTIGPLSFPKKGDALEYFKSILNKYGLGERLTADDNTILLSALKKHPDAVDKIGCGVAYFTVNKAPEHRTRCFWVHRTDGTYAEFSYKYCIN